MVYFLHCKIIRIFYIVVFLLSFFCSSSVLAKDNVYYKKSIEEYAVPDVILLDQNGIERKLSSILSPDKPLVLDFMYGTCTTICPILSASFSHFQKSLGNNNEDVQLISISIDPDNDTPELMKEYLAKYGAKPGWDILTGNRNEVVKVLKEFDAYVSNKMDHFPLTIMRAPGHNDWVRLYGMLSASDLKREFQELTIQ